METNVVDVDRSIHDTDLDLSMSHDVLQDDIHNVNAHITAHSIGNGLRNGSGIPSHGAKVLPRSNLIMNTIANMALSLGEYRRQLIPLMLKLMTRSDVIVKTRRHALCTVMHLGK
jgi:hypothetical protein